TPDKPAILFGDSDFVETYGELEARSRRIAHWLRNQGLKPGDCVATLVGNSPNLFDLYWATQRIGLYLTPLNWHANAAEIAYILDNVDAQMLIAEAALAPLASAARGASGPLLRHAVSLDGAIDGFRPLEDELTTIPPDLTLQDQQAGSVMMYSSGTTGRPKGI